MANLPAEFLLGQDQISITDNYPFVESNSQSLIYYSRRIPGHRYEFNFTSIELESQRFKEVSAKLAEIKNENLVVIEPLPIISYSEKTETFTTAAVAKGLRLVNVTDSSLVSVGTYFKFDGHAKVYQVVSVTGNQIKFAPNLVRPVNSAERLQFNNVPFSFKLVGRPQEYAIKGGRNSFKVEIRAVEVY